MSDSKDAPNHASDGNSIAECVLDMLPLPALLIDPEGRVVALNDTALEYFALSRAPSMLAELLPDVADCWHECLAAVRAEGGRQVIERCIGRRADGSDLALRAIVGPPRRATNTETFCIICDDLGADPVTAAGPAAEISAGILQASLDALITIDQAGFIVEFNPAAERVFGYRRSDVIGRPIAETVIPPGLRDAHLAGMRKNRVNGDGALLHRRVEITGMRNGGEEFPVELTIVPVDVGGRKHFTAALRDISKRKQAQADLEQARHDAELQSQAKSRFIATVSHEIRTPLSALAGAVNLLAQSDLEPSQRQFANVALEASDMLLTVVSNTLDFAKIEAGQIELAESGFDPGAFVANVCEVMAFQAADKGLRLATFIDPKVASRVSGDKSVLRQVLVNLLSNAIKFTEGGGIGVSLNIDAGGDGDDRVMLRFRVQDTGIGIAPDRQSTLFDEFTQAHEAAVADACGTGLGLAICKRLIELLGGQISVDSVPGIGTSFEFTVAVVALAPAVKQRGDLGRGVRALLLADVDLAAELLSQQLDAWGFDSNRCHETAEAVSTLVLAEELGEPYQWVLVQRRLPERDLASLVREIEAQALDVPPALLLLDPRQEQGANLPPSDSLVIQSVASSFRADRLLHALQQLRCEDGGEAPANVNAAPPIAVPATVTSGDNYDARILLAEDSPANQLVALSRLRHLGFQVEAVSDGAQALAAVADGGYDMVLMDMRMPNMDGLTATREIRKLVGESGAVPIIAMTANATERDRQLCLESGMQDFVTKPVDIQLLKQKILGQLETCPLEGDAGTRNDVRDPLINEAVLRQLKADTSVEMMPRMFELFTTETLRRLTDMQSHIASNRLKAFAREAHTLKGSADTFGLIAVKVLAASMERMAQTGDAGEVARAMDDLTALVEASLAELSVQIEFEPMLRGAHG